MQPTNNFFDNISIGVDIESIARFEKYAINRKLAEKMGVFTTGELDYCFKTKLPAKHLAARFCAKEAVYKAICGANAPPPDFEEIEIYHNETGVPQVKFLNPIFRNLLCKISLSHCKDKAVANVIIYKCDTTSRIE